MDRRLKLKVDEVGLLLRCLYGYNSVCFLKPATPFGYQHDWTEDSFLLWKHTSFEKNERKKPRLEAFPLKKCKRESIALSKHCTCKVHLLKGPYLGLFMFPFIKKKGEWQTRKAGQPYLRPNWGQNFHDSDKMKRREHRHYQIIISRELRPCVPFCFLSREGKSLLNVSF